MRVPSSLPLSPRGEPPAPATRPVRFLRITSHEARVMAFLFFTNRETGITAFALHRPSDISSGANQAPPMVFTNHGLYGRSVRRGCPRAAPPETAARSLLPCPRWPAMIRKIPQMCAESRIPQKNHCLPARCCPRCSDMARRVGGSKCPHTVSRSRPDSRQAPLAGKSCKSAHNPVYRRKMREVQRSPQFPSPSGLVLLRRTHNEPMLRKGNVLYCVDKDTTLR